MEHFATRGERHFPIELNADFIQRAVVHAAPLRLPQFPQSSAVLDAPVRLG